MPSSPTAESNFLVPNATFIVELIAFAIILYVLAKYVVPPVNRALVNRQASIKRQFDEAEQAKADARKAEEEFRSQLVEARHEASRIREEAREQGAAIIAEMREQAQAESRRIVEHARAQLEADRQQVMTQLRADIGEISTTLAAKIVGESLEDDERRGRTVERFIAELEQDSTNSTDSTGAKAAKGGKGGKGGTKSQDTDAERAGSR
jgi:F-type H+-transporting ATPase subunit b